MDVVMPNPMLSSKERMQLVRDTQIPENGLGIWFLGQNGFILKTHEGVLLAIDPYLTDSCSVTFRDHPLDLSRAIPVFLQPEDLLVDAVLITHSHADHLDEETIRRIPAKPKIIGPWETLKRAAEWNITPSQLQVLHPHQTVDVAGVQIAATFAIPTDNTDLNHIGLLLTFANGITFYNTGDTAFMPALEQLLPSHVDLCAICVNGKFNNLSALEAAQLVHAMQPRVAIPTHFDMMKCNLSDPEEFRAALLQTGSSVAYCRISYDQPFLYLQKDSR